VKVTVLTTTGDAIEGTLKGATPFEISNDVAGQLVSIPTANVKYISFVEGAESVDSKASTTIRKKPPSCLMGGSQFQGSRIGVWTRSAAHWECVLGDSILMSPSCRRSSKPTRQALFLGTPLRLRPEPPKASVMACTSRLPSHNPSNSADSGLN
jgi:hypothetical protein